MVTVTVTRAPGAAPDSAAVTASVCARRRAAARSGRGRGAGRAIPGGALAALPWLTSSAAFSLCIGTYGRLYGSLAGVVVFLVWLWVSHLSLLAGARFAVGLGRGD